MSTSAAILQEVDGGYRSIYIHWDGYPEHMMPMLENYNTDEKLNELLDFGNCSSIGENIHDSTFYCRDKGENFENNRAQLTQGTSLEIKNLYSVQYVYIFEDDKWKWKHAFL